MISETIVDIVSFVHGIRRAAGGLTTLLVAALALAPEQSGGASTHVYRVAETKTVAIWLSGEIKEGDFELVKRTVDRQPNDYAKVLMLESTGGLLSEGLLIGRYVRQARISTMVPLGPGCHSACSLIFLAGTDGKSGDPRRIMVAGAAIGFHQATFRPRGGTYSEDELRRLETMAQNTVAQVEGYLREIKAAPEFLSLWLSAPSTEMKLISEFEALRLGIYVMDARSERLMTPEEFNKPR